MKIKFRDYQRKAIDSIAHYFLSGGKGNPLIVAPTGSGKSVMLGGFCCETLQRWPTQRLLMTAHRKELIQQNYTKIIQLWSEAPVGVYSAGLKSRQLGRNITIGGIASIYDKHEKLGWQDLMLVDEAHLIPSDGEGMYRTLINGLLKINPKMKIVGFTATPFRMKSGMLTEPGGIFTDIAYDIDVGYLVKNGYLAPLISKIPKTQADLTNVHTRGGEFVAAEAERAMDNDMLTEAAIAEMEVYLEGRKSIIVFAAGVEHAQHVCAALRAHGKSADVVIGESDDMFRAATIEKFRRGQLEYLVNCDVLTTGFDAPNIDGIVLLRPTQSVGLYVQMCGRGMRVSPETGKTNCIVLDFARNIERHGPIDDVKIQRKSGGGVGEREVSVAPTKVCPVCHTAVAISVRVCIGCNHNFAAAEREATHDAVASTKAIMATVEPPARWVVSSVAYSRHESKKNGQPSLKVRYLCTPPGQPTALPKEFTEWVCLEHRGPIYQKAVKWWLDTHANYKEPHTILVPISVNEALKEQKNLRVPTEIFIQKDKQYDRVVSRSFAVVQKPAPQPAPQVEVPVLTKEQESEQKRVMSKILETKMAQAAAAGEDEDDILERYNL